jgi:hypothetical protein
MNNDTDPPTDARNSEKTEGTRSPDGRDDGGRPCVGREYLFVGGSKDGQRMAIPNPQTFIHVVINLPNPKSFTAQKTITQTCEQEVYELRYFTSGETVIPIYALEGLSNHDVFERLVASYQKPKQEESYDTIPMC